MPFHLRPGAPLSREVRRLINRQLTAAIAILETVTPGEYADRVRAQWGASPAHRDAARRTAPWPRVA